MSVIDLFRITLDTDVWTLTSANREQTYDAGSGVELYIPTAMSRSKHEQKDNIHKADLELQLPIDHEICVLLLTAYIEQVMSLTIFTDTDGSVQTTWKGRLASIKPGDTFLTIRFESIFTSLRRPGLRARYQKSCRHALYGRGCNLLPATFAVAGTVTALVGTTVTVTEAASQVDGYFIGGMLAAPDGALAYVVNHVGSTITIQRINFSLQSAWDLTGSGLAVTLYPGCNHSRGHCVEKFNNLLNYGGFDWIPQKNPMGGNSIV